MSTKQNIGCRRFKAFYLACLILLAFCRCFASTHHEQTENIHYIIEETTRAGVKITVKTPVNGESEITKEWTDPVSGEQLKMMTKTESEILSNGWEKRTEYVKYGDGEWLTKSETVKNFLGWTGSIRVQTIRSDFQPLALS